MLTPNVWLFNAMWRAYTGHWKIPAETILREQDGRDWQDFGTLINTDVRQYALSGDLPIWGVRQNETMTELIPAEYWADHAFDLFTIMCNREPKKVKIMELYREPVWRHFKTNKAAVEKIWSLPFGYKSFTAITQFIGALYVKKHRGCRWKI